MSIASALPAPARHLEAGKSLPLNLLLQFAFFCGTSVSTLESLAPRSGHGHRKPFPSAPLPPSSALPPSLRCDMIYCFASSPLTRTERSRDGAVTRADVKDIQKNASPSQEAGRHRWSPPHRPTTFPLKSVQNSISSALLTLIWLDPTPSLPPNLTSTSLPSPSLYRSIVETILPCD